MNHVVYFIIEKHDSQFFVCDNRSNSSIVQTHLSTSFPGLPKDVAELLCEDLNTLPAAEIKSGNLTASLVYCVLSTLSEAEPDAMFEIDLPFFIQWDRAYRLNPGPPHIQVEYSIISKIISFHKGDWVDLPLNYCRSLEELEQEGTPKVPEEIVNNLQQVLSAFNRVERFAADLLFNSLYRVSISAVILWVAGIIDNMELQKICAVLFYEKDSLDFSKSEKEELNRMYIRLSCLSRLIQISKEKDLVIGN